LWYRRATASRIAAIGLKVLKTSSRSHATLTGGCPQMKVRRMLVSLNETRFPVLRGATALSRSAE